MYTNSTSDSNMHLLMSDECHFCVRALHYSGRDSSSELLADMVFSGSVTHQLEGVRNWLLSMRKRIPSKLIYEMAANAIIHRDYSLAGETVIRIYSGKAQIVSLGGIPNGLSPDDIRMGISVPRNPALAEALRTKGFCMLSGSGMTQLSEYCTAKKITPVITASPNAFFAEIPFIPSKISKLKDAVSRKRKTVAIDQESVIIEYIRRNGSIKRSTVQKLLKVGQTRALNILSAMTESGRIFQSGSGKKTVYLLTERED